MFKIKSSYGRCKECDRIDDYSCIMDTNTKNLEETDILFVAENPGKLEVEEELPLQGPAGNIFKIPFTKYIEDKLKWTISNTVLCQTNKTNGNTDKPTDDDIDCCKANIYKLVEMCNPKVIFIMGKTPMMAFGVGNEKSKITRLSYNYYDWNGYKVFLTPSPNYYIKNSDKSKEFRDSFKKIRDDILKPQAEGVMSFDMSLDEMIQDPKTQNLIAKNSIFNDPENSDEIWNKIHLFKIDSKYYTDEYRLIDIQHINKKDQLIFIFRDKDNNKIFYEPPRTKNNYYYYRALDTGKLVEKVENLELVFCNFKKRENNLRCFESDVHLNAKHAVDYFMQSKGDPKHDKANILFLDIEVYTFGEKGFPFPQKAEYPISAISMSLDGAPIETFLLHIEDQMEDFDKKVNEYKSKCNGPVNVYTDEPQMVQAFVNRIHELSPDILTAWNMPFDMGYIYNRMRKINLKPSTLSPFDNCFFDNDTNKCIMTGYIIVDMLDIYKSLRESKEENYTLQGVSERILKKGKLQYEGEFYDLYQRDIKTFIEYNRIDVQRLIDLNEKLRHIELIDELRVMASTTWQGVASTTGQAEGLFFKNLREQGMVARNKKYTDKNKEKEKISGAFVKNAIGGIYDWLCDWDFSSLYPNIVRTWNIGPNTFIAKIPPELAFEIIYNNELEKNPDDITNIIYDPLYNNKSNIITHSDLAQYIKDNQATISSSGTLFKGRDLEPSIFFEIYNYLLETRKEYKKKKFNADNETDTLIFHNKQWALKILANSLYGVLLNDFFRFYSKDLGLSITTCGQEASKYCGIHLNQYMETGKLDVDLDFLKKTDDVQKYLAYMDTDSLFIRIGDYIRDNSDKPITVDEIFKTVAELNPILNKTILDDFIKKHNIPVEYSFLELKQEIIADRAYFLNVKKKYAMHIINNEGHECDKLDIKGIEVKRSDYPKYTKEVVQKILDIILYQDTDDIVEMVLEFVEEAKEKATNMILEGNKDIAKPVSFNKPINEYKNIPRGVKGMISWNNLEHETFVPGTKGLEFTITSVDIDNSPTHVHTNFVKNNFLGKKKNFTSIVLPDNVDKLPDYYKPDINHMLTYSIDDRVNALLEPLFKKEDPTMLKW